MAKNKHCFKHLMLFFTSTVGKSLDTDSSMESLFYIRAEKNLYRLNVFHWGKDE